MSAAKAWLAIGVTLVLAMLALLLVFLWPAIYHDHQGWKARKAMSNWSEQDCSSVWNQAKLLSEKYPQPKTVDLKELPLKLREAGFESGEVDANRFVATHGGTSFTPESAAVVQCYFDPLHESGREEVMMYGGQFYHPLSDDEGAE